MSKRYLLSLLIATLLLLPLVLTGCGGLSLFGPPTPTPLPFALFTAQDVFAAFTAAGLETTIAPEDEQIVAGRDDPADYDERVVFQIASIAPLGGQVITFENAEQLAAWQAYIESQRNNSATRRSVVYVYFRNNVMVQLNSSLTNAQAEAFRAALEDMTFS